MLGRVKKKLWLAAIGTLVVVAVGCSGGGSHAALADWRLTAPPEGTTLHLLVAVGNSCSSFERIEVSELKKIVRVDAYIAEARAGSDCDDLLKMERAEAELEAPIGDRELIGCDVTSQYFFSVKGEGCRAVVPWR